MRARVLGLILILIGCGSPLDVQLEPVDLDGDLTVSPMDPGTFRVTVENRGGHRITWGMGSSSCQLSLVVVVDTTRHSIDVRICTEDVVEQGLDGGERRTEEFSWTGQISDVEGRPFLLPEGQYRLHGVAGDFGESRGVWVRVIR